MAEERQTFTGRDRRRRTTWAIKATDWLASTLITVGGIGTIVCVLLVCLFLVWVVIPLFGSASVAEPNATPLPWSAGKAVAFRVDEHRVVGWAMQEDGRLVTYRVDTGEPLGEPEPAFESDATATAVSTGPFVRSERDRPDTSVTDERTIAVGYEDGSLGYGVIAIKTDFIEPDDMPVDLLTMKDGEAAVHEYRGRRGMVERTPLGQFRMQSVVWTPVKWGKGIRSKSPVGDVGLGAIRGIDVLMRPPRTGPSFALATDTDDGPTLSIVSTRLGAVSKALAVEKVYPVPGENAPPGQPAHLAFSGLGDKLFAVHADGRTRRFDTRRFNEAALVERTDLVEGDAEVTAFDMLLGRDTLVVGDSNGGVSGWFAVRPEERGDGLPADGQTLVRAHALPSGGSAVRSLGVSSRTRSFVAGFADGRLGVYLMTTDSRFYETREPVAGDVGLVGIAPKDDALYAAAGGELWSAEFDRAHPEITVASLFRPVWYEGYAEPTHEWQSSGGSQSLEPKYGLVPLVFGTLKATFYSLLFGVPLALFAAIYSSEFLHPATKNKVKPTIEVMASLPSVVLGFLAALVFAPVVERMVPAVLASFVTVPVAFVLAAKLKQLLPDAAGLAVERWRFPLAFVCLPLGLWAAWLLGPVVESLLFDGDVMLWLNDRGRGNGVGAWLILLLPLSVLVTALLSATYVQPRLLALGASRRTFGSLELARFVAEGLFAIGFALLVAWLLVLVGLDPRGSYVDTYVQRNALVVGFVMGFAIIPIIYTIADDALSSVPDNLRAASLGAGATPWQTTLRIVIPTATSGLFSAVMVGLGRAVGETMIVLMAAGNTPVMEWNVFNGFRTLSANIAVELPEAPKDGTHYRTLFLAALVLFVLTFVVNTIAEFVRLRYRKRVVQL